MTDKFTTSELEAYLDEALAPEWMAHVEAALRTSTELAQRLIEILRRRDSGVHSLGEIWRRHRTSCPTREQLGSYLLNALDPSHADYVRFHLEDIGCRICAANVDDMQHQAQDQDRSQSTRKRRRNYFQSSVGYLARKK